MRVGLVLALAAGLLSFLPARSSPVAMVGECSFDLLVGKSDRIVLAKVDRIESATDESEAPDSQKLELAHATVLETWKGKGDESLIYRCSRSWMCDITEATVGEVVVLLLDSTSHLNYGVVMDSGRGRLPVSESKGEKYATLWVGDVELPLDTETFQGPDERYDFIRKVKLDTLRSITKALVARRVSLKEMVEKSDAIVVATTALGRVHRLHHVGDMFLLTIEESWKGTPAEKTVTVRRPAAWPLDLEPMLPDQRTVCFLTKPRADGSRDLVEDGRGRMLLTTAGDDGEAEIWTRDVDVPRELPVAPKHGEGDREDPLWGRVKTAALKQFVTGVR